MKSYYVKDQAHLKPVGLFLFPKGFKTVGTSTARFRRMIREFPHHLVAVYDKFAPTAWIEEDMQYITKEKR